MTNKLKIYLLGVREETKKYIQEYNRIMNEPSDPDMITAEEMYIEALHDEMFAHFEYKATAIDSYNEHLFCMRDMGNPRDEELEQTLRQYAHGIFNQLVEHGLYSEEGELRVKHESTYHSSFIVLHARKLEKENQDEQPTQG